MFYFKFHIGDYRSDAQHLTLLEHGVYFTLMSTYYITEEPLPKDERKLFRLAGARTEDEKQAVLDVVSEFFIPTETHWVHPRIDFEISEYRLKADANRENGKKGGRPKKNPPQKPKKNPDGFESLSIETQMDSEMKPNNNPDITLTNKPINQLTNDINIVFLFWKEVFKKTDRTQLKGVRETKIKARLKEGYTVDEIKQAILNISCSQHHIDGGHTDIELICRDQSHLDKYIAMGGPAKLNQSPENKKQDLVEVEGLW